jgi:hypothetical protein
VRAFGVDVEVGGDPGNRFLYVTASTSLFVAGKKGRIDVFQLAGGELPDAYAGDDCSTRCGNPDCTTTSTTSTTTSTSLTTLTTTATTSTTTTTLDDNITQPLSTRKKMYAPGPFVLSGEYLYVFDGTLRQILTFQLDDGLFTDEKQPRIGDTNDVGRLLDLVLYRDPADPVTGAATLFGAADSQGRVLAFGLKPESAGMPPTKVPKNPQRRTKKLIETTPVRIAVTPDGKHGVLYVPGGEANRLYAYDLTMETTSAGEQRLFPAYKWFSRSEKRKSTFPNDVAIAPIESCPP